MEPALLTWAVVELDVVESNDIEPVLVQEENWYPDAATADTGTAEPPA